MWSTAAVIFTVTLFASGFQPVFSLAMIHAAVANRTGDTVGSGDVSEIARQAPTPWMAEKSAEVKQAETSMHDHVKDAASFLPQFWDAAPLQSRNAVTQWRMSSSFAGASMYAATSSSPSGVAVIFCVIVIAVPIAICFLIWFNSQNKVDKPRGRQSPAMQSRTLQSQPLIHPNSSSTMSAQSGGASPAPSASRMPTQNTVMKPSTDSVTPVLCPALIVNNLDGVIIDIMLSQLLPSPQRLTIDCRNAVTGEVFAKAVVSERENPGIMVESVRGEPLAFLDTSFAMRDDAGRGTNRHIILRQAQAGGWDVAGTPFAILFLNQNQAGSTLVARLGDPTGKIGRAFLSANLDNLGNVIAIVDAEGRAIALSERVAQGGMITPPKAVSTNGDSASRLRVVQGADACLVMCALLAVQKLR